MTMTRKAGMALMAVWLAAGAASGQSALTLPNNSAGSQLDVPPMVTPDAEANAKLNSPPTRSDSSGAAFQKLDPNGNGYITRGDFAKLGGGNFDAADLNHD